MVIIIMVMYWHKCIKKDIKTCSLLGLQGGFAEFLFRGHSFPDTLLLLKRLYIHLFSKETVFGTELIFSEPHVVDAFKSENVE